MAAPRGDVLGANGGEANRPSSVYLAATDYIESKHPRIREFLTASTVGAGDEREVAVRLFYAVRDEVRYDPYTPDMRAERFRATTALASGATFCTPKAVLLAASARAAGIPSRLRFADVRNHLTTPRLRRLMRTDLFVCHGYTELFVGGRWVKATPTFNRSLCEKFGVRALDFDGEHDATLHPFDHAGQRHMEYVRDRGHHADLPLRLIRAAYHAAYPHLFHENGEFAGYRDIGPAFEDEAAGLAPDPAD